MAETNSDRLLSPVFKKIILWFKKDSVFKLAVTLIFAIGIIFRFWDYYDRIVILADNSRDIQVAKYALDYFRIPQIGQFSSAGPFFYGPWYYWILMVFSKAPLGLLSPWYMMSLLSLVFVLLIFWLGKEIGGRHLGALAAFFAVISPAQISNSLAVWNPAIIPLLSVIILIFMTKYFSYRRTREIFIFGFVLSLAITIHFQSILLLPVLIVLLIATKPPKKHLIYLFFGLLIPFLPLIYFDVRHYWYDFKSVFIYLAIDQYSIYVPNRWLTYVFSYWPLTWGQIIGGNKWAGGAVIILLAGFTLARFKEFNKNKIFYLISLTFVLEVLLFRYYRGPRYEYYSYFTHPTVLILSAWALKKLVEVQRLAGIFFIILVVFVTLNQSITNFKETGISFKKINILKTEIYSTFPKDFEFSIYGCKENTSSLSHPLALFIYNDKKNNLDGIKIGVCETAQKFEWVILSSKKIQEEGYVNKTTSKVFTETAEWWKENPPQKDAQFWQFMKRKLNPSCYPHCL